MAMAAALGERGRAQTWPNPNVGCVIVKEERVIGRGWTQAGGRPHAEAMALAKAGTQAKGATLYTTLEPCAHDSHRGPTCSALIVAAGVARVAIGVRDPDERTNGKGMAALNAAGVAIDDGIGADVAARSLEGFLTRQRSNRPHVTLKLALSIDGALARADGESRWITGEAARAHAHIERARTGAILVGRGTWDADQPSLTVRLAGLEQRAPLRCVLSSRADQARPQADPVWITTPEDVAALGTDHVLIEGGAGAAAAFIRAGLVDRLLIYTAPILIGAGRGALGEIGLTRLADAHGRWQQSDSRRLGSDRLDVYERVRA
jgi:diaminohydroxyphosphoribosylaminopyrimidine deaminase / 5-amino-6-(5-phosphoribosylamino)uracil reductase